MQCAACNALHDVTQRCCRWLLETHDRVDSDEFPMKQEFLSIMLGVRRPTVTVVLRTLQEAGLISCRYGRIRILNRRQLERRACECYRAMRAPLARRPL
jgi:CRP-like cAMP-binding protein